MGLSIFRKICKFAALTTLSLTCAWCAQANVIIESSESATRVFELINKEQKLLGNAPLTLTDSVEGRVFLVEKAGFVPVTIPIYKNPSGDTQLRVNLVRVSAWVPEENDRNTTRLAEAMTDSIFEVQALLDSGNFKDGLTKAQSLKTLYPNSTTVGVIFANALLMNGDNDGARIAYQNVLADIPADRTSLKSAIEAVSSKLNRLLRSPASHSSSGGKK